MAALFTSGDGRIRVESRANGITWFYDGRPCGSLRVGEDAELASILGSYTVVRDTSLFGPTETPTGRGPSEVKQPPRHEMMIGGEIVPAPNPLDPAYQTLNDPDPDASSDTEALREGQEQASDSPKRAPGRPKRADKAA